MKIEFVQTAKGRDFKVGDIVEFKGMVEEGYAQKYIARGWARLVDAAAAKADMIDQIESKPPEESGDQAPNESKADEASAGDDEVAKIKAAVRAKKDAGKS